MRHRLFFLLLTGLFLGSLGCADREHDNPLDPQNPRTHGKPSGLRIYNLEKQVFLSWDPIDVKGFLGMKIFRRSSLESSFTQIAFVPDSLQEFVDTVEYGMIYSYVLQAVTETYESPFSDEVKILPGPSYIWAVMSSSGEVAKLTFDASHLIFLRGQFIYPNSLTVSGYKNGVWISDYYTNGIIRLSESGERLWEMRNIYNPLDLDYDAVRNRLWIAEHGRDRVVVTDTTGRFLAEATGFSYPNAVSVDESDGVCWVADVRRHTVVRLDVGMFNVTQTGNLFRPEDVAADPQSATCWVADSSRVVQIDRNGNIVRQIGGFIYAIRVAVDEKTGDLWVLDYQLGSNESLLIKYSASGERQFSLGGFSGALSLDVDEYDGSCIVADTWNYRIVKVLKQGFVFGEWKTPSPPRKVRVATP